MSIKHLKRMNPKVSVIVPNYNHAPYLEQRIESILNQTYQDFELILLDDCSTDNSIEVLSKYATHPKVSHYIVNEQNSGSTFKQWDKGINLAAGEWIWIAESDDWAEITLLQILINAVSTNKKIVLGYVQSQYVIEENDVKWVSAQNKLEETELGTSFIKTHLLTGNAIFNASMAIFNRSAYYNVGNEFKTFKFCGDWLFWAQIAQQGDVFISGKILNYFRNHGSDVSNKAYATGLNFIEELKILFYYTENMLISDEEFFDVLKIKHDKYKFSEFNYTENIKNEIETLFYNNISTIKYESVLKNIYTEKIIEISKNNKKLLKQQKKKEFNRLVKSYLRKIGLWKKESQ